jgi:geranylgeranyl pyrophosphate synthase
MFSPDTSSDTTARLSATMDQVLRDSGVASPENKLLQVARYALSHSGKMLRGRLLLEVCRAVSGSADRAFFAATALEYLHLGTLIHDDIIDGDELRRGQASVWWQYDLDLALLSGDLCYFIAFQSLARDLKQTQTLQAARILEMFSTACIDLCFGQTLEEKLVANCAARYEDYLEIVRLKTSRLFRAALEIGTLLGGGNEQQVLALGQFAEHLGIAFQIIDDLLPFIGNRVILGKPVTSDIKNHRLTLPMLYALAATDADERQTFQAIFEQGRFDQRLDEAYSTLHLILERTGALKKSEQEALSHYQQAIPLLQVLPPGIGRDRLTLIASQIVQRSI